MEIKQTAEILKKGGIILYPADTVWGIGCDACNDKAVERIFALKQRTDGLSMLTLVADFDMIARYVRRLPDIAADLVSGSDKPLTVIYPDATGMAAGITASDGSVGIRVTSHDFCVKLIRALDRPLVSTSANISGRPSPKTFDEISDEIKTGVDFTVPRRFEGKMTGKPSSIIKLGPAGEVKTIRP